MAGAHLIFCLVKSFVTQSCLLYEIGHWCHTKGGETPETPNFDFIKFAQIISPRTNMWPSLQTHHPEPTGQSTASYTFRYCNSLQILQTTCFTLVLYTFFYPSCICFVPLLKKLNFAEHFMTESTQEN